MNITFVSDAIYPYNKGGKEKRLYELSTRLAQLGHDVHIYTMHWWDSPERSRIEDGVHLHAIGKLWPMYKGDKRSIKEGLLFGLACLRLFRVKFEILDVDHMPFFPIYSAWFVCLLRRKRLYGTWHEALSRQDWLDYMGTAGNIAALIERISVKLPNTITSSSPHTQRSLERIPGRPHRVELVTPGVDTKLMKKLALAKITCDVLYTGRLVKDKNVDKLIEAVALLQKELPKIQCLIIGHGVEKLRLQKLITKLSLQKNVRILEPLEKADDVYAYMKAAKVFCLPSVREGFGMVVLEALACNTPVITIDTPANASRHLVHDGIDGSLVPLDSTAIAQAIRTWTTRKPSDFSTQVSSYDWDNLAKAQAGVYAT